MAGRRGGTSDAAKNHSRSLPSPMEAPHPSFFRVILPYMLEKKKLKLPLKFVKTHGSELSSLAALTLPNGGVWKVGVEKVRSEEGEEIWFSDGWAELVEHHSICAGYFLVFRYSGVSAFTVEIFDFTTCSIEYPKEEQQLDEEDKGSPNYIVIPDDDEPDGDRKPSRSTRRTLRAASMRQTSDVIIRKGSRLLHAGARRESR